VEQRRAQRYKLQLPLEIIRLGGRRVSRTEKTRDISSGGVCFVSADNMEVGGRIEYLITLSNSNPPVKIRCLGKVLRSMPPRHAMSAEADRSVVREEENAYYEVACTMERYSFVRPEEFQTAAVSQS
jgi:hypothetical protein